MFEFECTKFNHKTNIISLIQYFNRIKNIQLSDLNEFKDKCEIHKDNNYKIYCFDCERHLCKKCLKSGEHMNHTKNYIEEIESNQELEIISEIIKERKNELEKLYRDKNIEIKKLTKELKRKENKENYSLKKLLINYFIIKKKKK